jgi:myosin heavy subunit
MLIFILLQSSDRGQQKPNPQQSRAPRSPKPGNEVALQEEEMLHIAAAAAATAQLLPSLYFAKGKEMGEISEKIHGLSEENNKLREKLKTFKKDNAAMNQKIGSLQDHNQKKGEIIRALESSQEKLQKELDNVKKAKEQLRIEIEEKTSKFSKKNDILTEKLEALKKEFEAVENENKDLKRSLEELTNSNNSLKQTVDSMKKENQQLVDSIKEGNQQLVDSMKEENQQLVDSMKEENQQLKDEMGILKDEHKELRDTLECKEARLALGQVSWLLEAEIWKAVLPDQNMGKTGILFSMKRWLIKNSSTPEGKAAQKRWDDLKGKLNWVEEDHIYALRQLKELRKEDAHPENVDLEVARKQLNEGDHVADADKEICEEIIDMVVTARKLNSSK